MDRRKLIIIVIVAVLIVISAIVLSERYLGKDLTITKLSSPTVGVHGQNITVNITLKNKGILGTPRSTVFFYLTTTKTTNNKTFIGMTKFNNLSGLATVQQKVQITIPMNTTPGTYYILANADPKDTLKELNENNNELFSNKIVIS